jgi:hypothetical protein
LINRLCVLFYLLRKKKDLAYRGRFKPKHPEKYKGDPTKIIWRSTWELSLMRKFDSHPDIVEWRSEEIAIPYINPAKKSGGRTSRYFPDFVIKKRVGDNKYQIIMIEVKPKKQTMPPDPSKKYNTPSGRVSRQFLKEAVTYEVNKAKWEAAERYCRERGWTFQIMHEDHIKPLGK